MHVNLTSRLYKTDATGKRKRLPRSAPSTGYKDQFMKGTKRDKSHSNILKDEKHWDTWRRSCRVTGGK